MKTAVFYSYKGGTGRTLAVANVATLAATIGRKVVVIDMDLEAPGTTYKLLGANYEAASGCRGLVGYLLDTITTGMPQNVADYVVRVPIEAQLGIDRTDGRLVLMPAGRIPSSGYFGELRRLNFDARAADGSAVDLMLDLLGHIEGAFAPDLVLIDARTGITNSNSLALSELADEVYAFYLDLPEQRDGTRMVLRSLAPLAREGRPSLTAVLSRVPVELDHSQAGWTQTDADRHRLESAVAFLEEPATPTSATLEAVDALQLHHHPNLVGAEELILPRLAQPGVGLYPLAWDYARLARRILRDDPVLVQVIERLKEDQPHLAAVLADDPGLRALAAPITSPGLKAPSEETLAERIEAQRATARRDPAALPLLASSLVSLSRGEREIGRRTEALEAADEAAGLYRALATMQPDAFNPDLAMSLNNLGLMYDAVGRREDALAVTEEAANLRRVLAAARPDAFNPDLARSLTNYAERLKEAGQPSEAADMAREAVDLRRPLAKPHPVVFGAALEGSLITLADALEAAGRPDEAAPVRAELDSLRHADESR